MRSEDGMLRREELRRAQAAAMSYCCSQEEGSGGTVLYRWRGGQRALKCCYEWHVQTQRAYLHSHASNLYHNNYLVTAHRSPLAVCTFTFIFTTIQMTVRRPPVRASPTVTVKNSSHSRRVYAVVTQIIVKASHNESMEQANCFVIGVI
jgi:hypothetical protein